MRATLAADQHLVAVVIGRTCLAELHAAVLARRGERRSETHAAHTYDAAGRLGEDCHVFVWVVCVPDDCRPNDHWIEDLHPRLLIHA